MKDHYGINGAEFAKLSKRVSTLKMIQAIPIFDKNKTELPISKICLFFYIDDHGDFRKSFGMKPDRFIALAIFNSMEASDQIDVYSYLEWTSEQ